MLQCVVCQALTLIRCFQTACKVDLHWSTISSSPGSTLEVYYAHHKWRKRVSTIICKAWAGPFSKESSLRSICQPECLDVSSYASCPFSHFWDVHRHDWHEQARELHLLMLKVLFQPICSLRMPSRKNLHLPLTTLSLERLSRASPASDTCLTNCCPSASGALSCLKRSSKAIRSLSASRMTRVSKAVSAPGTNSSTSAPVQSIRLSLCKARLRSLWQSVTFWILWRLSSVKPVRVATAGMSNHFDSSPALQISFSKFELAIGK